MFGFIKIFEGLNRTKYFLIFIFSLLFFFKTTYLHADKGEILFGLSYFNDYINNSSNYSNKQILGNYLKNIDGIAGKISYIKTFAKSKLYYRLNLGYDYSFEKSVNINNDLEKNSILNLDIENKNLKFSHTRYEISPVTLGVCLDNSVSRLYFGIGPTYTNYKLTFKPDIGDKLDLGVSGIGFNYQIGMMAKLSKTTIFFVELNILESPLKTSIKSNLKSEDPNISFPDNTIYVNPRYQRVYFGVGISL